MPRYAEHDGLFQLIRGADNSKDQTYFLHQLGQQQLAATLFPIGHLPKLKVREMAKSAGFGTAEKKDSTGICFIGERDFRDFLSQYIPAQSGEIRSVDGTPVGEHAGVCFYTLGQREGLHIGGIKGRAAAPWFVVGKDVIGNILYVDQGIDSLWLHSSFLSSEQAHWIAGTAPADEFRCTAKTRLPAAGCRLPCAGFTRWHAERLLRSTPTSGNPRPIFGTVSGRCLSGRRHHCPNRCTARETPAGE